MSDSHLENCPTCGHDISSDDGSIVHCESCGAPMADDAKFCSECGVARSPAPIVPPVVDETASIDDLLRGSRVRIGRRANEQAVRRALASDRVVHLATHGILNSNSPMFSRIELSPSGRDGSARDGRLEVHEVLGLTIRSPLVFLSGCETGLGAAWSTEFSRGEDYTTLAQAFLYAGANNVIATLWPIADDGAAVFVENFYTEFQRSSPAESLVSAQRLMLSDSRYRAPYYWAAYQLASIGAQ